MPDVDEINSSLGALEKQLEELSRLKGLVQSLSERETAANEAVQAAEKASAASSEVIEQFESAASRIEDAEVIQHVSELRSTIQRFEEVGGELESKVEELPEVVKGPLVRHHEEIEEALSDALSSFEERLGEAENSLGGLQKELEKRLDDHHADVTDALTSAQERREKRWDQADKTLNEIGSKIVEINGLLQEAQLRSRLDTLQDTASNANQAAQNGLSRIDAVERSLSDTLSELRRQQDRQAEQMEEQIEDLQNQILKSEASTRRILWVVLTMLVLTLGVLGAVAYVLLIAP